MRFTSEVDFARQQTTGYGYGIPYVSELPGRTLSVEETSAEVPKEMFFMRVSSVTLSALEMVLTLVAVPPGAPDRVRFCFREKKWFKRAAVNPKETVHFGFGDKPKEVECQVKFYEEDGGTYQEPRAF